MEALPAIGPTAAAPNIRSDQLELLPWLPRNAPSIPGNLLTPAGWQAIWDGAFIGTFVYELGDSTSGLVRYATDGERRVGPNGGRRTKRYLTSRCVLTKSHC